MKLLSFKGGTHPHDNKEHTANKPIRNLTPSKIMIYPMSQHIGAPCEPIVKKGDRVLMGQKIGESTAFVSVPVHSTVSGTVIGVEPKPHPNGTKVMSVIIENDFKDEMVDTIKAHDDCDKLSKEEKLEIIKEAGIVGHGGATFPVHIKLNPPADKKIDCCIVNGAECEPYLTSDYRVMLESGELVINGLIEIMKILDVSKAYIGIENNKPEAIEAMKKAAKMHDGIEVCVLKTKYPQGSEKHLIDLKYIKDDLPILEKNGVAIPKPNSIIISDWHNVEEAKQIFRKLNIDESNAEVHKILANCWGTVVKGTDDKCHVLINSSFGSNSGKFIHEMGHIHQDSFRTSFWHSKGLSDREFIDKQLKVFGLSDIGICDDGVDLILRESGDQNISSLFRNIHYNRLGQEAKTKVKNMFPNIVDENDYLKLFSLYGEDRKNYVINAKKMVDKMYSESGVYAPAKTWENVAEIFEGLNKGKEYSDLVMLMYDINGGGRVPNLVIKGMKYDDYIESLYNNKDLIRKLRECIEVKELV